MPSLAGSAARPEFLNRIDELLIFQALTEQEFKEIVPLLSTSHGVTLWGFMLKGTLLELLEKTLDLSRLLTVIMVNPAKPSKAIHRFYPSSTVLIC